jgi:hypothetical protein
MKKQIIKFNNTNPIALCNECSITTDYVRYKEDDILTLIDNNGDVPLYCEKCFEVHSIEKAKLIIKSCVTREHFDGAMNYLDQYLKTFSNGIIYRDLIELMDDRKKDINFK